MSERIDLSEPIAEICRRLDVPLNYVSEIHLRPSDTTVVLFAGNEGRGAGAKFIGEDGEAVTETLEFETRS